MSQRRSRKPKKRKWTFWVGIVTLSILVIMAGTVGYYWNKLGNMTDAIHDPLPKDNQKELDALLKNKDSINVLLLGVDARSHDKGRSDTIILMSINPKTNSTLMVSIPRDTYVNIPGRGMDKINHAYAFGDTALSVETVEKAFDLPIHFYVRVNMEGFEQGIDTLGGVTVQNDQAFSQGGSTFAAGPIRLTGEQALDYTRMRKKDPRGDLGRNERQRNVIEAALKEGANLSSITKIGNFLDIAGGNVKTNMNRDNLEDLFKQYRQTFSNNGNAEINGNGQMINGVWYYVVPDNEFSRVHDLVTAHMEKQ